MLFQDLIQHLISLNKSLDPSEGFPGGASGKEPTCQWGRHKRCGFNLWVRKMPWRRAWLLTPVFFFFNFIFFISWRLITLQYCSGFCHTLKWISHGFTCVPHPDPPSHLPLHPIPLGLYMEFRKMLMITLYAKQKKRHRCIEQTFGLWEKVRVGYFKRTASKHVYYLGWNRSPAQVGCMRQALGPGTYSNILAWRIPMDRGAWWVTVHGVAKSQTWLKWLSVHADPRSEHQHPFPTS